MINIEIKKSINCNGDYSLFITFNYNSDVVAIVKSFPTRVYNKDDKSWEVPFNKLGDVVDKLSAYDITISGEYIDLSEKKEVNWPKDFQFKTKPYAHQIEGVEYGLTHDRWLLGDEQGLGKTKQVIDNKYFTVRRIEINGELEINANEESFVSFTFLNGEGFVNDIPYEQYDTFFLPYGKKCVVKGKGTVVISMVR